MVAKNLLTFVRGALIATELMGSKLVFAAGEPALPPSRKTPDIGREFELFNEGSVLDQVIMESEAPKVFDWQNSQWELELGLDNVNERNVFPSSGWHAGAGFALGGGFMMRTGLRRVMVSSSSAGSMLEKTPFRQVGQPTRWEVYGLASYSLLEGRTSSRLSPYLSDAESVFSVEAGAHYVHPSRNLMPTKNGERSRVPGQKIGVSSWVLDLGVRYEFYVPSGVGLFLSMAYQIPRSYIGPALGHWTVISLGTVYAFGDQRRP
jgi:hypothetical protein